MKTEKVLSLSDLKEKLEENKKSYLLIYKSGSEQSECALKEFSTAAKDIDSIGLYTVDVSQVRDIHSNYQITTAPSLLEFDGKKPANVVKGCHESKYFKAILEEAVFSSSEKNSDKPSKRVIVYTTPTCTWCNTLKSYLRENKIRYNEIDVSRDQNAAEEMTRRSGQQGVPQTDINGQMIVGFDKNKINRLLELN